MKAPFANRMARTQTALGWCYLPFHAVVLPLLLSLYAAAAPGGTSSAALNLVYHGVGLVFTLTVMFRFLRGGFDALLDRPGRCLLAVLLALLADYVLSLLAAALLLLVQDTLSNPNNAAVMELAAEDSGAVWALAIFLAPIVEETLFRGVVFGSLRGRSRVLAYIVSALLFGIYHVWQYALGYADASLLLYAVQYIPVSLALAWCYEHTESIWPPIFAHMIVNAISFAALTLS